MQDTIEPSREPQQGQDNTHTCNTTTSIMPWWLSCRLQKATISIMPWWVRYRVQKTSLILPSQVRYRVQKISLLGWSFCHDEITHLEITWRFWTTRFSGSCGVASSLSSQVLFMALIIQHGGLYLHAEPAEVQGTKDIPYLKSYHHR